MSLISQKDRQIAVDALNALMSMENDFHKQIKIYDDIFDFHYKSFLFSFLCNSKFKIGWSDGSTIDKDIDKYLHSWFSKDDITNCLILEKIQNSSLFDHICNLNLEKVVCNLSTSSDSHFIHTHLDKLVLVYYANLEWRNGWHGETLFYDDSCKNIIFASPYTPGRIIVFDGSIPHTIRPQSTHATKFRFTLSLFFS